MDKGIGNLDSLYREVIMDHYKNPSNFGPLANPSVEAESFNPLCGDRVKVSLKLGPKNTVTNCNFEGEGCAICMASASIMTEEVLGKNVEAAKLSIQNFRGLMAGKVNEESVD